MPSELPLVKTIKDIEKIEEIPFEDRLEHLNTYDILKSSAQNFAENDAVIFLPTGHPDEEPFRWTFKDLFENINKFANYLNSIGVAHDEAVSCILPNLLDTYAVMLGSEAQAITNPINPLLEIDHIAGILKAGGGRTLVTIAPIPVSDIWQKSIEAAKQSPNITTIVAINMSKYYPILPKNDDHLGKIEIDGRTIEVIDFDDATATQNDQGLDSERVINPTDIASYFHTGGTTGVPKLAQHTHLNEAYMTWAGAEFSNIRQSVGSYFCGLPLFHVNAFFVSGLIPFLHGATVILATPQGYRGPGMLQHFWKLTEKYKMVSFSGVPTIYAALMDVPIGDTDISSLKFGLCGAAPMPPELITRFQELTNVRIIEGYGLTESTCIATGNPRNGESRVGSIGIRLPYAELNIIKLDEEGEYLRDCQKDEIGNIALKGPGVFPGYKETSKNKGTLLENGWLNTGDLARIDEDGYVWLTGRSKDLIIRGGHNIDPSQIEEILSHHEDVELAAAVGQPDARVGEVPVAFVQIRAGHEGDGEAILDYAKKHITERAACPVRIEIIETMPLTAVGKIYKPALRHLAIEHAFNEALSEEGIEATVTFENDPKRGDVAIVSAGGDAEKASTILSKFPVAFDIRQP